MNKEFLFKEYECNFEQLRYYDSRHDKMINTLFAMITASTTAGFGLYKLHNKVDSFLFWLILGLGLILLVFNILLYLAMQQNRLYFVYTAKQLNSIRYHFTNSKVNKSFENQLYTSTQFSAFKPFSIFTYQSLGSCIVSGILSGIVVYSISEITGYQISIWAISYLSLVLVLVLFVSGGYYLQSKSKNEADRAIHHEK